MVSEQGTDAEVNAVVARMGIDEKIELLSGKPHWFTKANRRHGIPAIQVANGPSGLRPYVKTPLIPSAVFDEARATAFPAGIGLGASWDPTLCERIGRTIADECNQKGVDLLAGPVVCLSRIPVGGRNFESYGEDPLLSGKLAGGFIRGVEADGVGTSLKHFVGNDSEYERHHVDIRIDEVPLHELYLRAFRIAIAESNPSAVMIAYPRINGVFVSDNEYILTTVLRKAWGYDGLTISDWGAVKSGRQAFIAGSDLEMPGGLYFTRELRAFVEQSENARILLDQKVRRIVRFALDRQRFMRSRPRLYQGIGERRAVALEAARESLVLLRNEDSTLPLAIENLGSIAVIGPNSDVLRTGGGGSSFVCPERSSSPLSVIGDRCGTAVRVMHAAGVRRWFDHFPIDERLLYQADGSTAHGMTAEFFNNMECRGEPVETTSVSTVAFDWGDFSPRPSVYPSYFSARFTGRFLPDLTQQLEIKVLAKEGVRLVIDGVTVIDLWSPDAHNDFDTGQSPLRCGTTILDAVEGRSYDICLEYFNTQGKAAVALGAEPSAATTIDEAVRVAAECDAALLFVGTSLQDEGEGHDLVSPRLPDEQVELIRRVARENSRTIVVLNNGTPLFIDDWVSDVPALLEAWFPGQEGSEAVADVLFGRTNPSGKLPVTFFRSEADCPSLRGYPGSSSRTPRRVIEDVDTALEQSSADDPFICYSEGLAVGYRAIDMHGVEPLFPFGFGLSFTEFGLAGFILSTKILAADDTLVLRLTLSNHGSRPGAEVIQLYAGPADPEEGRPPKNLISFSKVRLGAEEEQEVVFSVTPSDFERYDANAHAWRVDAGAYRLFVGTSSLNIHATFDITLV